MNRFLRKAFCRASLIGLLSMVPGVHAEFVSLEDQEKATDRAQMLEIRRAIFEYKDKHGELPLWLSDLAPEFIEDPMVFISPRERRTGRSNLWGYQDPKLHTSYVYEFSGNETGSDFNVDRDEPLTMRDWKTLQMEEFGPAIPILRCHLYESVLSVSYSGDVFESGLFWESEPEMLRLVERLGVGPGSPGVGDLTIQIVDAAGNPISDVRVDATHRASEFTPLPPISVVSDASGSALVRLARGEMESMTLSFGVDGYARAPIVFDEGSPEGIPEILQVTMRSAATIGGRVVDASGNAISRGTVEVLSVIQDEAGQFVEVPFDVAQIDSQGRWSSSRAPADFDSWTLNVEAAGHFPKTFYLAEGPDPAEDEARRERLLDGTAELELEPGNRVFGVVSGGLDEPVEGARLTLRHAGPPATIHEAVTGADGRYEIVVLGVGPARLLARAEGFAPEDTALTIGREIGAVDFSLRSGLTMAGRVVNEDGAPVAGAGVSLASWRGGPGLEWGTLTDSSGEFEWEDAPEGPLTLRVTKEGFGPSQIQVGARRDLEIAIGKKFQFSGTIVDADTGQPIPEFFFVRGRVLRTVMGDDVRWDFARETRGANGTFSVTLDERELPMYGDAELRYLFYAEGYQPVESEKLPMTGWHDAEYAMIPGQGPRGVVVGPDLKPVEGAEVAVLGAGYITLGKGKFETQRRAYRSRTTTDALGRFQLPAVLETPTIFAVSPEGICEIESADTSAELRMVLKPWGRIEGILKAGTRPWPGQEVILSVPHTLGESELRLFSNDFKAETDDNGAFVIDPAPPGTYRLVLLVKGEGGGNPYWSHSHAESIDVKAATATQVVFGGKGRPVVGRLALSNPDRQLDWNSGRRSLYTTLRRPPSGSTREEIQEFYQSPEYLEAQKNHRTYAFHIAEDGAFRIENIVPGSYELDIRLTEGGTGPIGLNGTLLGQLQKKFEVPEMEVSVSDEPFELGELTVVLRSHIQIGAAAPEFECETLGEDPLRLSDFKGKWVFLDFWATWCGPCIAELPYLKDLYAKNAEDEDFVMLSLSLDAEKSTVRRFVARESMDWTHGFLGEWSQSPVPDQYGVQGIPSTFLINPEGRIVGKHLRGAQLADIVSYHRNSAKSARVAN